MYFGTLISLINSSFVINMHLFNIQDLYKEKNILNY